MKLILWLLTLGWVVGGPAYETHHELWLQIHPKKGRIRGTLTVEFALEAPAILSEVFESDPWAEKGNEREGSERIASDSDRQRSSGQFLALTLDGSPIDIDRNSLDSLEVESGAHRLTALWSEPLGHRFRNAGSSTTPLYLPVLGRRLCPCLDDAQKSTWTLLLEAPSGWSAMANAPLHQTTQDGPTTLFAFERTPPIQSRDLFLGFGAIESAVSPAPLPITTWKLRSENPDHSVPLADVHHQILPRAIEVTNYPLPYRKLDLLLIPNFTELSRSWPGVIGYRNGLAPSKLRLRAAREIAAQWTGHLVSTRKFDEQWFLHALCDLLSLRLLGDEEANQAMLGRWQTWGFDALAMDGSGLTLRVNHPGVSREPFARFKAMIFMGQLEKALGDDVFWNQVRGMIRDHSFGFASWSQFSEGLGEAAFLGSEEDWTHDWVEQDQPPRLAIHREQNREGAITECRWEQSSAEGEDTTHPLIFDSLVIDRHGESTLNRVRSTFAKERISSALGLIHPRAILLNGSLEVWTSPTLSLGQSLPIQAAAPDSLTSLQRLSWGAGLIDSWHRGLISPTVAIEALRDTLKSSQREREIHRAYAGWYRDVLSTFPEIYRQGEGEAMARFSLDRLDAPGVPISVAKSWLELALDLPLSSPSIQRLRKLVAGTWQPQSLRLDPSEIRKVLIRLSVEGIEKLPTMPMDKTRRSRKLLSLILEAARDDVGSKRSAWERFEQETSPIPDEWLIDLAKALGSSGSNQAHRSILNRALKKTIELRNHYPQETLVAWIRELIESHQSPEDLKIVDAFLTETIDLQEPFRRWMLLWRKRVSP